MSEGGEQEHHKQGKTNDKNKPDKKHRARPITDKFELIKVPIDQVQHTMPQYGQPQQSYQSPYWTQPTPYNTMSYSTNYTSYGYQQPVPSAPWNQPSPFPVPQVNPNYYNGKQSGGRTITSSAYPNSFGFSSSIFGSAPYSSSFASNDSPKQSRSPPAPVAKQANDSNAVMKKLTEMHSQMTKLCQLLTKEIKLSQKALPQVSPAKPIEQDIERFNQLLAKFNDLCQSLKQSPQWHANKSNSPTASSLFADRTLASQASSGSSNRGNGPDQAQLASKIAQVDLLYKQARSLGAELHNLMLSSIALPDNSSPKGPPTSGPKPP